MDFVVFLSNFFLNSFFLPREAAPQNKNKSVSEFFALGTQNPRPDARERERRKEARLFLLDRAKARREASPCLVQS